MNIPSTLRAGDSWSWVDSLPDYPAPTWDLVYNFRGPQAFTVTASDSGSDHALAAAATATAVYKAGVYDWIARVNDGTNYKTIGSGRLTVEPDLANAAVEYRSFWRQVLDELEPVILGRASTDQLSMSIAGRSLQRMSWDELLKVYDRAKQAVAGELGDSPGRYTVAFDRP
jgi:hypothetical protein